MQNKTILVSAYSCEPNRGSEPGVGWDFVSEMQKYHNLIVVTRSDKSSILKSFENSNLKFVFVSVPFFRKNSKYGFFAYLHYYLWQLAAYFKIHKKVNFNEIDIYHHITFVNSWAPSFLAFLPTKKFIWGPIGEHPEIPVDYLKSMSNFKVYFNELARKYLRTGTKMVDPFFIKTKRKADAILCINENISGYFNKRKVFVLPAISIDPTLFENKINHSTKFKIYFCGNLVYWKGIYLAIEAFKKFCENKSDVELYIIGEGDEKAKLVEASAKSSQIKFVENLPQKDLFHLIADFDVFLYPSFEGGGMVVLEALAMGKPIVCLNYGGPGSMVNETCGFKTNYSNYTHTINELGNNLELYYQNPALLKEHSENAVKHVKSNFGINKKIQNILALYEEIS